LSLSAKVNILLSTKVTNENPCILYSYRKDGKL